jgi:hypothetical protein
MKAHKFLTYLLVAVFSVATLSGCAARGTSTGNPLVSLHFASFSSPASAKVGTLSVSQVIMCFKRLRFKQQGQATAANPAADSSNIDFSIGEVTISPSGTDLGSVQVPPGTYTRVEFDLESSCLSGASLQVQNSNGTFSTADRITIKFSGSFVADQTDKSLSMDVTAIINCQFANQKLGRRRPRNILKYSKIANPAQFAILA